MLATTCLQHRFWWLHLTISFDDCWRTVGSALLDGARGLLNARGACDFQYGPCGNRTVGSPLPLSSTALGACLTHGARLSQYAPPLANRRRTVGSTLVVMVTVSSLPLSATC